MLWAVVFTMMTYALLCVLAAGAGGADPMVNLGSFFKMMSETVDGCKMTCPEGLVPVSRPGHIPTSNGCGSLGIKLDTSMFPGLEHCCDTHDKCYDTCNEDRDKCDSSFQTCLNKVCKKVRSSELAQMCKSAGDMMHVAATGLCCTSFIQAQNNACVCAVNKRGDKKKRGLGKKAEL